jgi:hypothetical protein
MEPLKVDILKSEDLNYGVAQLRSDGILTFDPNPAVMKDYTVEILEEMLEVFLRFSDGSPMPYFCDNRYILGMLGADEKEFIMQHFHKFASVFAMTVSSPITRLVANTFVKIQKPPVQLKMFRKKEDAINWLLSFE